MNKTEVQKRLVKAVQVRKTQLKKWGREKSMDKVNIKNVTDLQYRTRRNYFTNYKDSCGFNPETCEAHSYRWYSLAKKIKGIQILNDYRYSNQTSKHISKVCDVFSKLKIKYVSLEAPRGLQDLDAALKHAVYRLAKEIVANKYARNKTNYHIKAVEQELALLKKLGKRTSKKAIKNAIANAEVYRREKLDSLNARRVELRAMARLEIIADPKNKRCGEAGLHVFISNAWAWNDKNEFVGTVQDYYRRDAISKGFTKIIVHYKEVTHPSVVG